MKDCLCQSLPMDFRKKIGSHLLYDEEDYTDDLIFDIPFNNASNPCALLNQNYLHYVHLRNCKKSKSVV